MNDKKNFNVEENFLKAIQNHKKNNYQIAEEYYKKVLEKELNHFKSIFYLGTLYIQTKRFEFIYDRNKDSNKKQQNLTAKYFLSLFSSS